MIEQPNPLSLTRQCELLGLSRAALYYRPAEVGVEELELMALIDRQYLRTPFYGSRRMAAWLQTQGYMANRKRAQRLMRLMGLETIYQRPHTSRPAPEHRKYPYFLRGLVIGCWVVTEHETHLSGPFLRDFGALLDKVSLS